MAVSWLVRSTPIHQAPISDDEIVDASAPAAEAVSLVAVPIVLQEEPQEPDEAFYIFDNGSETDFSQGSQGFGTDDKLGVPLSIWNQLQANAGQLMAIGDQAQNTAREQFLLTKGKDFTDASWRWNVHITRHQQISAESRVLVYAYVGKRDSTSSELGMGVKATVVELWRLEPSGPTPTLLDRTDYRFDGFQTTQESPVIRRQYLPTIQLGVPPDEPFAEDED